MQKQDKDLYKQLLVLQETIQGLKVELKRERDECEEAFRDLQEISSQSNRPTENKQSTKPKKQQTAKSLKDKKADETESNIEEKSWKHDRQDSGISVKNCDVEPSSAEPAPIRNSEAMKNSAVPSLIQPVIRHSKQDSGILLDEDTENETKLLSRLMQSSKALLKSDNRKLQTVHNRLRQVVKNGVLDQNLGDNRSRSSSDLSKSSLKPFNRDVNSRLIPNHSHSRSCPSTSMKRFNPESCDYKVVPASHHVRPTQRSASVVNLDKLNKKEHNVTENWHSSENGIRSNVMAKSVPNLAVGTGGEKAQPLRAVLVSACEVSVSNASERRCGGKVSRQSSLDAAGRMDGAARGTELIKGQQRRFTVLGVKPERAFYDSKHLKPFNTGAMTERNSGYSSPSLQLPRNHVRHSTMPENNEKRRCHSLRIWHSSSKSWDGYMERPAREFPNLLRSSSQVSLV